MYTALCHQLGCCPLATIFSLYSIFMQRMVSLIRGLFFWASFVAVNAFDASLIFVYPEDDHSGERAVKAAIEDIGKNKLVDISLAEVIEVPVKGRVPKTVMDSVCLALDKALKTGKAPIVLDITSGGIPSETVKSLSAELGLPTLTTAFGQAGEIKAWHALQMENEPFLVQVSPPADILLEVIRALVLHQKITNVAVLHSHEFTPAFKVNVGPVVRSVAVRIITRVVSGDLKHQIKDLYSLEYQTFFVLGDREIMEDVLEMVDDLKYNAKVKLYFITLEDEDVSCNCDVTVVKIHPEPPEEVKAGLDRILALENMEDILPINAAFFYDIVLRTLLAVKSMTDAGTWPLVDQVVTCNAFSGERADYTKNLNLLGALKQVDHPWSYAPIQFQANGENFMTYDVNVEKWTFSRNSPHKTEDVGTWKAGLDTVIVEKKTGALENLATRPVYRVVTNEQPPFVIKSKGDKYSGLCIDLLDNLSRALDFDYIIYDVPDGKMGYLDENGEWSGVVNELLEKRADIGMTAISIMVERERVISFTMPYYDLVGISILMKKQPPNTSLFKFLTVLEADVWLCILAAYFLTSFLMWVFDRWSPYSYQNNKEKYKDDEEKRIFGFKECLWFCMTSLTPQGGGEAPKNLSGRLVAATWWLFGFIIMASYTANLAAFLTVSRLDTPIESLEDLAKQYKIQYAPQKGSSEMNYFSRMANIENRFYEIWKDMSLNDSLTPLERSKLAVWDYPVSDKYTKMWQAMTEAGMPNSLEDALVKIRNSTSSSEGFALLNDAAENMYLYHTNCDLQIVGDEFSRKPYAIALQKGSHLMEPFNNVLQELINQGELNRLKKKWWDAISIRETCEELNEETDGISIKNIGGVFIVIFLGIAFAATTLTLEYFWYKYQKSRDFKNFGGSKDAWAGGRKEKLTVDATGFANRYLNPRNLDGDHFTRRNITAQRGLSNNTYYNW